MEYLECLEKRRRPLDTRMVEASSRHAGKLELPQLRAFMDKVADPPPRPQFRAGGASCESDPRRRPPSQLTLWRSYGLECKFPTAPGVVFPPSPPVPSTSTSGPNGLMTEKYVFSQRLFTLTSDGPSQALRNRRAPPVDRIRPTRPVPLSALPSRPLLSFATLDEPRIIGRRDAPG